MFLSHPSPTAPAVLATTPATTAPRPAQRRIQHMLALLICATAWGWAGQARADINPALFAQTAALKGKTAPAYKLDYALSGKVKGLSYTADSVLNWQPRAGGQYHISVTTRKFPLGSRTQTSQGRITAQGLRPDRMTDDWRGGNHALFERKSPPVISFSKAGRNTQPLIAGAQDQVSLAVHMAALVAASPGTFVPGKQLAVQVAGINGTSEWLIGMAPPQSIDIDGTRHEAISLRQIAQPGQKKTTQVWLVRWGDAYIPAKIRVSEANGDYAEQLARRLPELPAPPTADKAPAADAGN